MRQSISSAIRVDNTQRSSSTLSATLRRGKPKHSHPGPRHDLSQKGSIRKLEDHVSRQSSSQQTRDLVDRFLRIIDEREPSLRYVAYGIVGNPDDLEGVLQNAYLQAYRKIRNFSGHSEMHTWLYRIVINAAID